MNKIYKLLHWRFLLSVLIICTGSAVLAGADEPGPSGAAAKDKRIKNVGVAEFDKLRTDSKSIVLDVRTPNEYALGHIPDAVNIDWNGKDFTEKVAALDRGHTYLVHCAAGVRSAKACDKMDKLNFKNVYNLEGGMKVWEKAGKPVEKSKIDSK
jgi:rhodanese-related sulfurtransferase